jgi:hypothetical protein
MPALENLTEADLKHYFSPVMLNRAQSFINSLTSLTRDGVTLTSTVIGPGNYRVEVEVAPDGIYADCGCSYSVSGSGYYCFHIGATLLAWIRTPRRFAVKKTDDTLSVAGLEVIPVEPPPTTRPNQLPTWITLPFAERHRQEQENLAKALEDMKLQDLRQMAKKRGWAIKGTQKAAVTLQIVEQFTNPHEILAAYQQLDTEHLQVYRAMVVLGNAPGISIETLEKVAKWWGPLKKYKNIITYTSHMVEWGLAVSPGNNDYSYPSQSYMKYIPHQIVHHAPLPLTGKVASPSDADNSELQLCDPYDLSRRAVQLIMMLEQHPIPLRPPMPRPLLENMLPQLARWNYVPAEVAGLKRRAQTRRSLALTVPPPEPALPDAALERLAPLVGDQARFEFVFALLRAGEIIQPGSPVAIWPEVKNKFLTLSEDEQRATLARLYFHADSWNELWELIRQDPQLVLKRDWQYFQFTPEQLNGYLLRARLLVLRVLACLPDDTWVSLDSVYPLLKIIWPRFDGLAWQPPGWFHPDQPLWFLANQQEKPYQPHKQDEDWDKIQGRFTRYLIARSLYWLGLADVRFTNNKLTAVRLHGLAELYWDKTEAPPAPNRTISLTPADVDALAVTVEGQRLHVTPSAISAHGHSLLDKIARLENASPGQFTYQIDALAVHQSFEAGQSLAQILEDWAKFLPIDMPSAIEAQLSAWWQAYGQVRIYQDVTLIEFDDDHALREMRAVTSLDKHLVTEISPRLVMISAQAVPLLVSELEKAGYTPKQTDQVD